MTCRKGLEFLPIDVLPCGDYITAIWHEEGQ